AGLAVAALRDVLVEPCLLHRMQLAPRRDAFDRDDALAGERRHRQRARSRELAVDANAAGATARDAATVLGSGQRELVAQIPQQRTVEVAVVGPGLAVDVKPDDLGHGIAPPRRRRGGRMPTLSASAVAACGLRRTGLFRR